MERCIACHGPRGRGDGYVLFTLPVADLTSELVQKKVGAEKAGRIPRWDHGGLRFLMEKLWP